MENFRKYTFAAGCSGRKYGSNIRNENFSPQNKKSDFLGGIARYSDFTAGFIGCICGIGIFQNYMIEFSLSKNCKAKSDFEQTKSLLFLKL